MAMMSYGVVQLTIPLAPSPLVFMIQYAFLGLLDGMYLAYIVPIAYDLANKSPQRTNQVIGMYYINCVLPSIFGPALAGKIYQHYHSYYIAFLLGGTACIIGALIEAFSFLLDTKCLRS
jgi:MFS family permease